MMHEGDEKFRDLVIDENIILRWILKKYYMIACTGFISFKTGTNDRLLCIQRRTFGFHKRPGIS
jgi:hypothetical protein